MRRIGYLLEQIADMDNMRLAFYKAQRRKQDRDEVQAYRLNLQDNLLILREQILSGNVQVGQYDLFRIFDPKERVICAAAFSERVLHHALMNICEPYINRTLINHTYANRKGKGVYAAISTARTMMQKYRFVAKLDVRKYFDSISHDLLKRRIAKLFKDGAALDIFSKIIDSYSVSTGRGLPIGNLTSQHLANFYLSLLDHSAGAGFVRYMDDMLVFDNDRGNLLCRIHELERLANEKLDLTLKPPILHPTTQYTDFLGYRLAKNRIYLTRRSRIRFRKKMQLYEENYICGIWDDIEYQNHLLPLFAFAQKAYTKQFRKSIIYESITY